MDLISRQDAIDALGDEPLIWDENDDYDVATRNQWRYDVECIKEVPSIHLRTCEYWDSESNYCALYKPSAEPEIIRCKDCKYMTEHYDTDGNAPYWACSEWDAGTDYDGFCHYAERRQK